MPVLVKFNKVKRLLQFTLEIYTRIFYSLIAGRNPVKKEKREVRKMKVGEVRILGIKKTEKENKVSFSLYGETPFEDWEMDNSVGTKVVQEWTNRVDLSSLKPGDVVTLSYAKGFQGAAVLNNVTVVSQAK